MQERRTLVYIDKDDIPSTALEVTSEALTGNVVYFTSDLNYSSKMYSIYSAGTQTCFVKNMEFLKAYPKDNSGTMYFSLYPGYLNYSGNNIMFLFPTWASKPSYQVMNQLINILRPYSEFANKYVKITFTGPVFLSDTYPATGDNPVNAYGAYIDNE